MYVEITSVAYDKTRNSVTLEGIDLDAILDSDWDTEAPREVYEFEFDLDNPGNKKYLYLVVTNKCKNFKTVWEGVQMLTGKAVMINNNFKTTKSPKKKA